MDEIKTNTELGRFAKVARMIANVDRPSTASVTNVLPYQSWKLWKKLWEKGADITQSEFDSLESKLVYRQTNDSHSLITCRTSQEWSNATSLNPAPGAGKWRSGNHLLISVIGEPDFWPNDFITKLGHTPSTSVGINLISKELNVRQRSKLRYALERIPQHAILII